MNLGLEILSAFFHLFYYLFTVFYFLIALRYLLDLLPLHLGALRRFLFRATEPFLGLVGRVARLHWRRHDFTPLLAVVMLVVFQQTVLRCLIYVLLKARGAWMG